MGSFDFEKFMKHAVSSEHTYTNYLKIVYYCNSIVEDGENTDSYHKLKDLLISRRIEFSAHDRLGCYVFMLRFCNYRNLKYGNSYMKESFEINSIILNEKLFLEYSQFLQLSFCRNYIVECKSLGEFDSIRKFIKNYEDHFSPEYRKAFINYCRSLLAFEKGTFEESLKFSNEAEFSRDIFRKDLKLLRIKTYYELGYMDSFFSEIDSFRHFLSSNSRIKPAILERGKKFASYIKRIALLKEKNDTAELHSLSKKLEKDINVNERNWLKKKLA